MWSETTVINPEGWSAKVEGDLARGLGLAADDVDFVAACADARSKLQLATGPQTVTLTPAGAIVTPYTSVPTPAEHAANEAAHEAHRARIADPLHRLATLVEEKVAALSVDQLAMERILAEAQQRAPKPIAPEGLTDGD